jgi:sn-glycerol 3-phosphate transport system substrate-binding protein
MRSITRRAAFAATLAVAGTLAAGSALAAERVKIEWWHAMSGELGDRLVEMTQKFNASQDAYEVVPVHKGSYDEVFNATIAAYRAKGGPVLTQVPERGFMSMLLSNAIVPVDSLMSENGYKIDWNDFVKPVFGYFSYKGKLQTMPFNNSSPILWYNADMFKQAGYDKPAETWQGLDKQLYELKAKGITSCGTSLAGDFNWSLIENYSAINDQPIGTKGNGFDGLDTEFVYNKTLVVEQVSRLKRWLDDGILQIAGQGLSPQQLFTAGTCATYVASTAAHAGIEKAATIKWSATYLPWEEGRAPKNATIGGATLWVMKGHPANVYKGAAAFLNFVASTENQVWWHKSTGYIPETMAAYKATKAEGFYEKYPTREIAILQLSRGEPTENSRGFHFGNFFQTAAIQLEEIQAIWVGKKTVQQGLDDAVRRGNELLRQYEKLNAGKY